jgi:hypothetical protein
MKIDDLHTMDPFQFELFVGQAFAVLNYNVLVTSKTSDGGIDLVVDRYDDNFHQWMRHVIQVKRYKSPIGIDKFRELNGILDLHRASFGCLITLSDFKQGVKQKVQTDFSRISSMNGHEFIALLRNAGMLDSEDNIIAITEPNLERNRKSSILRILRSRQPEAMLEEELFKQLRANFYVTVSDESIRKDVSDLLETGQVILIEEKLFYKPRVSEIQIALNNMSSTLKSVDYFVNENILFRLLEDFYSINKQIWEIYFEKDVRKLLDQLIENRQLLCVDHNLYATDAAIEKFRLSTVTPEQMKTNIEELLGIRVETKNKKLEELNYCPPTDKKRIVSGTNEESRKFIPFLNILFATCPDCGALIVKMLEGLCLSVTSNEIDNRLECSKEGAIGLQLKEIRNRFHISQLFTRRIDEAIAKYFANDRNVYLQVSGEFILIQWNIEIERDSTLQELGDKLLDICIRYQSFVNDVYAPIDNIGRPVPLYKMFFNNGQDYVVEALSEGEPDEQNVITDSKNPESISAKIKHNLSEDKRQKSRGNRRPINK